jgi:hypothetical protein
MKLDSGSTSELFEVKPGIYQRLLAGTKQKAQHIYSAPPVTATYITNCGEQTEVPVQHPWRED